MTESDDCMPEVVALLYTARSPTSSGRCWPKVDARTVCHVAATLHQWYTDESNGCIVRGHLEAGNKFVADENGLPFWRSRRGKGSLCQMFDHEKDALRQLHEILENYPALDFYLQTDPRGAPLWLHRRADLKPDARIDAVYSEIGVAVFG